MTRSFHILDVFTDTPLAGNPLAVVHDAAGLDGAAMQAIAAEFNLSETVFLLPPENPVHTAKVRIFTPRAEVLFAGHPTVGTAILLARLRWPDEGERDGIVVLEEGIGAVRVGVRLEEGQAFAEFDSPRHPAKVLPIPDPDLVAAALGLLPAEIGFENHRAGRWSVGLDFAFVPLRDLEVMRRCRIERRAFDEAFGSAAFVYCRETESQDNDFHARMFAPGMGVPEDPATGSAAAAFAGQIMTYDQPPAGHHRYLIEQGHIMGRPSLVQLELVVRGGLQTVRIGGSAVIVASGQLMVD